MKENKKSIFKRKLCYASKNLLHNAFFKFETKTIMLKYTKLSLYFDSSEKSQNYNTSDNKVCCTKESKSKNLVKHLKEQGSNRWLRRDARLAEQLFEVCNSTIFNNRLY